MAARETLISSRWHKGRVVAVSKGRATETTGVLQKCSLKTIDSNSSSMVNNIRAAKMLTNTKRTAVTL